MLKWLRYRVGGGGNDALRLSCPATSIPEPRTNKPKSNEPLCQLGRRKQNAVPENEYIFTTDPDPVCALGEPSPILGIDLGATHSVAAVVRHGKDEVIPNQEGQRLTPSVVTFVDVSTILVDSRARQPAILEPRRTVISVKRLLGRTAARYGPWRSGFRE